MLHSRTAEDAAERLRGEIACIQLRVVAQLSSYRLMGDFKQSAEEVRVVCASSPKITSPKTSISGLRVIQAQSGTTSRLVYKSSRILVAESAQTRLDPEGVPNLVEGQGG